MCGSASERTRAISWGEMVIEECPSNPAAVPRAATLLRLLASRPPGRKRLAPLRRRSPCIIRSSPRKRGPSSFWIPAFAGMNGVSTHVFRKERKRALSRAALPDEPCDGAAQLGYAGAGARGGHQHLWISGGMLGERRLGRGDERRKLGILGRVGFGQHDLVVDRGLVQALEHVGVDRLEAVAGVDQGGGAGGAWAGPA